MSKKTVLVVAAISNASHRQMVEGVIQYCERASEWETLFCTEITGSQQMRALAEEATAIVAAPTTMEHMQILQAIRLPTVLMGFGSPEFPSVEPDEHAIGRMAWEEFRRAGMRDLAFCGAFNADFVMARRRGYVEAAKRAGVEVNCFLGLVYPEMHRDSHSREPFVQWLRSLPYPTGLFVPTTQVAATVVHYCRQYEIRVPDQIAILGVDDDELTCNLTRPRLSAIDQAPDKIGYEAAKLMARLLRGEQVSNTKLMIPPRRVVARESTDLVNTDSRQIADAIRFIRKNVEHGIGVADVMRAVPMSRRALERGFKRNIGRSIHEEIIRTRVELARYLLDNTEMQLPDISERCGFSYPSKLSAVFKRVTGVSPNAYRKRLATTLPAAQVLQ